MLADVQCCGFPYALDRARMCIDIRALRGHVVAARSFAQLPARPLIYELSFACPRGLSGAPLFTVEPQSHLAGMVLGNAATDMLVLSSREVLSNGTTEVIEQYERLQLGIAEQAPFLLTLESRLLGGRLDAYLRASLHYS